MVEESAVPIAEEPVKEKKVVFFHHPANQGCLDGITAVWSLLHKWGDEYDVELVPLGFENAREHATIVVEKVNPDADVYFVDIVPRAIVEDTKGRAAKDIIKEQLAILDELIDGNDPKVRTLTIYDHHDTAKTLVEEFQKASKRRRFVRDGNLKVVFDMERSGAGITWDEEYPDQERPPIVELAEASDLLRLDTPEQLNIAAFLDVQDISEPERALTLLTQLNEMSREEMVRQGEGPGRQLRISTRRTIDKVGYVFLEVLPGVAPMTVPYVQATDYDLGRLGMKMLIKESANKPPLPIILIAEEKGDIVHVRVRAAEGFENWAEIVAKHIGETFGISGGGRGGQAAAQFTIEQHAQVFATRGTPTRVSNIVLGELETQLDEPEAESVTKRGRSRER